MKIEKRSYSRRPWRLIDEDGREVDYICPKHGYTLPVCAATKTKLVEKLLQMYEDTAGELRSAKLLILVTEQTSTEGLNVAA